MAGNLTPAAGAAPGAADAVPRRFFISYAHGNPDDESLAQFLYGKLNAAGFNAFLDESMKLGTQWTHEIPRAIESSDVFVCLISERTIDNAMVQQEVTLAHQHYRNKGLPKFAPVRVRYAGALDYVLGAYLGSYQWLDWRSETDSESLLRELIELAQRIADSTPALRVDPPQPRLEDPTPDAAPAVPLPTTSAAVHAVDCLVVPEVIVCFLHPERRKKLPEWRKWSNLTNVAVSTSGIAATMVESSSLEQAAERLRTGPERKILLLDGFEPDSAALKEIPALEGVLSRCDVIFNAPEWEEFVERPASSSLLTLQRAVTTDATVAESLRKMVLRTRARNLMTPRLLASEDELREYFSLRYRVWTELGYLPQAQRCSRIQWELDFTDRTSLPVGFFSRSNGTLLALARLVRGFGEENTALVRTIDRMIEETGSDVLRRRFLYPAAGQQHPFDILGELKEFQPYYRTLVTSGATKAELSRVIVHPDWQKHKFGEVIVDTLCALARIQRIRVLFLACRTEHERFYARCGFRALPNITGTHFLSYNVPCLAMERRFWSGDDPSRTEVSTKATYA